MNRSQIEINYVHTTKPEMSEVFPKLGRCGVVGITIGDSGDILRMDGISNESFDCWGDNGGAGVSSIEGNFVEVTASPQAGVGSERR